MHQLLRVDAGVVLERIISNQVEKFKVLSDFIELNMQLLNLDGHRLVVVDEGRLLFMIHPNLLHQVLSSCSLVLGVLAEGQALIGLN